MGYEELVLMIRQYECICDLALCQPFHNTPHIQGILWVFSGMLCSCLTRIVQDPQPLNTDRCTQISGHCVSVLCLAGSETHAACTAAHAEVTLGHTACLNDLQ